MSVYATRTVSAVDTSTIVPVNHKQADFGVSLAVVLSAGATLTYSVQHTFDDVQDSTVTPTWFNNSGLTGQTANADGNIAFPVRGVRLNVTAHTTGSATLTVLQSQ